MKRCYWGFHLILLVVDLGSHLLDHIIDQIIEFHTHNLSESHTLLSLRALRFISAHRLFCCSHQIKGSPNSLDMPPPPVTSVTRHSVHLWAPRHWLGTLARPQLSIRSRGWAGSGSGLRAAISLLSITTLPISVMVNSKQIQASTLTGSNTFLLLCCINSCHRIISGDDGWWRVYWIRFREGEGRGEPCYQFYCYDILRLPPSQTLVTIEAGGSLGAALCWGSWPWHLTMFRLVTDADLAPGGLVSNTLTRVAG